MSNKIIRQLPNTCTCLNLFSGCIATIMAYDRAYEAALAFMLLSAFFDFCDGMLARMLHAYSPLGKELDSLADDVSFGVAPAMVVFSLLHEVAYPAYLANLQTYIPYLAFTIAVFSALRLAKFNTDERQSSSFIGLPTPANAVFWGASAVGAHHIFVSPSFNALYLLAMIILSAWLLVAEIPMFSLKFKTFSWKENRLQWIFLLGCLLLVISLHAGGFAACVLWYILLSLLPLTRAKNKV
ncbi:MAG: CDP-diacylglycerol--serine O-phosphatidyltransferase [Prevotellaceae bacterium]|jgi:CDP-diacylglycerol--serine O-phosphatidyltransferase|nr:CDP-diacylglycerol--serine O-phosphatidyltransferase [Prevotellaceae bacterium]